MVAEDGDLPGLTPPIPWRNDAEEARCLVELLDESVSRGDLKRLREIVTVAASSDLPRVPAGSDLRALADIVSAMGVLRERIWVYRLGCSLRGVE
jgi:hypothetical protein